MAFQDQLDRLRSDVQNYVDAQRAKVQSLQDQIAALQGQIDTSAANQMQADTDALSSQLDQLEAALADQPSDGGGSTGTDTGGTTDTGGGTDTPPSARRR